MPNQLISKAATMIIVVLLSLDTVYSHFVVAHGPNSPTVVVPKTSGSSSPRALIQWTNAAGGYFDVGGNWATGFAPGINDSASFAINDVYSVDWDGITGDIVSDDLFVIVGDVTLRSLGSGGGDPVFDYTLNDDVTVGVGALLKIGDGTDGHNLIVGDQLLVDAAEMKVSRLGSLTANGNTDIGSSNNASGYLNLQDTSFDAVGLIRLGIGANAQGRIVAAADTTANTTNVDVGCSLTGNGRLEVLGENTVWNSTTELDIGNNGPGVMEIRLGGTVNSEISAIGWQSGGDGEVIVRHAGSQWNITTRLDLGATLNSVGTLLIEEGGNVSTASSDITIGNLTGLNGCEIVVEDQNSLLSSADDIFVGGNASGELTVQDNANVFASGEIFVLPNGIVNVAGFGLPAIEAGQIMNEGLMSLSDGGPDIFASIRNLGTVESINGAASWIYENLQNDGIEVHTQLGSETRVFGRASGGGPFTGLGLARFDGDIEPGVQAGIGDTGTISVQGNLSMSSSTVPQIEFEGSGTNDFDRIIVDGDVLVDGSLNIYQLDGFIPTIGDEFVFVEVGGIQTGQFAGLPEGALAGEIGGVNLFITYSAGDGNDIALTTIAGVLLGDVNLDGVVSLLDVAPFVDRISTGTYQAEADINQDGIVSLLDVAPFVAILSGS